MSFYTVSLLLPCFYFERYSECWWEAFSHRFCTMLGLKTTMKIMMSASTQKDQRCDFGAACFFFFFFLFLFHLQFQFVFSWLFFFCIFFVSISGATEQGEVPQHSQTATFPLCVSQHTPHAWVVEHRCNTATLCPLYIFYRAFNCGFHAGSFWFLSLFSLEWSQTSRKAKCKLLYFTLWCQFWMIFGLLSCWCITFVVLTCCVVPTVCWDSTTRCSCPLTFHLPSFFSLGQVKRKMMRTEVPKYLEQILKFFPLRFTFGWEELLMLLLRWDSENEARL